MATRIPNLQVTKVVDGDSIKISLKGKTESLRLICVDTEESHSGGSKPVTAAGKAASEMTCSN
jgi:micrococcal nuclease